MARSSRRGRDGMELAISFFGTDHPCFDGVWGLHFYWAPAYACGQCHHDLIRYQDVIRERLEERLNVTALARQLRVSREHLSRTFDERTGFTPYQYIQRQKILLACRLLKETSLSQKEIANQLAFLSPAHFSRAFHRAMLMTPSRFRSVGSITLEPVHR